MVKVQNRDVENFYSKDQLNSEYISPFGNTFRDYRNELELDNEGFYELNKVCEQENIPWIVIRVISDGADETASLNFKEFITAYEKYAWILVKHILESISIKFKDLL